MNDPQLNCREVFARLDDYVDRELSADEAAHVQDHLSRCSECSKDYAFETGVLEAIRNNLRRIDLPSELRDRVLKGLEKARREGDQST